MISIRTVGRKFRLVFPYDPGVIERVKGIPGRTWDKGTKAWIFPATSTVAFNLKTCLDSYGIEVDKPFERLLWRYGVGLQVLKGHRADPYECVTTPFPHQKLGTNLIAARDGTMLIWEMGTGKTKGTIDAIVNLHGEKILVVAPLSVVPVWISQFAIHAKGIPDLRVIELGGSVEAKLRRAQLSLAKGVKTVFLINYESVWRDPFAEWALAQTWDMVVLDESQRAKSHNGRAGRYVQRLGDCAIKRVALTGTPMPHDPLDIFSQMRFVDAGLFGTSWGAFKAQYTVKGGFMGKEVIGYRNQDQMHKLLYTAAHRVTKEEVLDLPEFQHVSIPVVLSNAAMEVYKKLDADFIAGVGDGTVTVNNALTELLRLQQITGGYVTIDEVTDETGNTITPARSEKIDTGKADALEDLLTDLPPGEKVVVFGRFLKDLDTTREAAEKCGREWRELSGRINSLTEWQTNKNADGSANKATVLAVQIRTGGLGVDMSAARYAVYFSLGFSLGDYEQSLARVHRQGQTRNVTYYHLIAQGTVDEKVYGALRSKAKVVEAILASVSARAEE